jgi:hypothetical protein
MVAQMLSRVNAIKFRNALVIGCFNSLIEGVNPAV